MSSRRLLVVIIMSWEKVHGSKIFNPLLLVAQEVGIGSGFTGGLLCFLSHSASEMITWKLALATKCVINMPASKHHCDIAGTTFSSLSWGAASLISHAGLFTRHCTNACKRGVRLITEKHPHFTPCKFTALWLDSFALIVQFGSECSSCAYTVLFQRLQLQN